MMDYINDTDKIFENSHNSNFSYINDNENHPYVRNLQEINKNLRSQLEHMFKLIKMKLKLEKCERLENVIDDLEILKVSLDLAMQKQSNIVKQIHENNEKRQIDLNWMKHSKVMDKEISAVCEKLKLSENSLRISEMHNSELEIKISSIQFELEELKINLTEEKSKTKNLVNLIKELEKKKSQIKAELECSSLREQVEFLTKKISDQEHKFIIKLEKKDLIIKKLDESLSQYEELRNTN